MKNKNKQMKQAEKAFQKYTKQWLKKAKKDKTRCKKEYPDWEDNEFNAGPLKFIWGVTRSEDKNLVPSFQTLNEIEIWYNRDTEEYLLEFNRSGDKILPLTNDVINWLIMIKLEFQKFAREDFLDHIDEDLSFDVNDFNGSLLTGKSIHELWIKFNILEYGLLALSDAARN